MSRRTAVAFFLGDAAFLADPKFRALARRIRDPDDFNSAVGAFWIALAAARRNGSPVMDVAAETESRFVGDLVAVGLLGNDGFLPVAFKEWSAMSPQQAHAGRIRAANAQRDERGRMVSNVSSTTSAVVTLDQRVQPSPPLPSIEERDTGGAGGEEETPAPMMQAIAYVEQRTRRAFSFGIGSKPWETLAADIRDFGWPKVQAAMVKVKEPFPDIAQLVFGASRTLHPIASGASEPEPSPSDVKAYLAQRKGRNGG